MQNWFQTMNMIYPKSWYEKDKIFYNGVANSKETFVEAIKNGCIVNIDS